MARERRGAAGCRGLTLLRRPGWILAALLAALFSAACVGVLAPWQLGKTDAVARQQARIEASLRAPVVPLEELLRPSATLPRAHEWREVSVTGEFLADHEVELRQRASASGIGVERAMPFRVAGSDTVIMVDRGLVAADRPAATAPAVPSGQVRLQARLRAAESTGAFRTPRIADGVLVGYAIDPPTLAAVTGLRLAPYYLQLRAGSPGALHEPTPTRPDQLPHLSYGIQWLALGVLAPAAVVAAAVRHGRRSR